MKLKMSKSFFISLMNVTEKVVMEFDTNNILSTIKTRAKPCSPTTILEQSNLQLNLEYNLQHKTKPYLAQVKASEEYDELLQQFEKLKKRLVNEINLPCLVAKGLCRYVNYYS